MHHPLWEVLQDLRDLLKLEWVCNVQQCSPHTEKPTEVWVLLFVEQELHY